MRIRFVALVLVLGTFLSGADTPSETREGDLRLLQAANLKIDADSLLTFFRSRTPNEADREKIAKRIAQLGDEEFAIREAASAELVNLRHLAIRPLKAAQSSPDAEVARRAEECLGQIEQRERNAGGLVTASARLLAEHQAPGAAEVLLRYLTNADLDLDRTEVARTLATLTRQADQPDPALVAALTAKDPSLRAVAGPALAAVRRDAVRPLLTDADLSVRHKVALALAEAQDREAIPVLIDLLGKLSPTESWPAEELLQRLAGEKSPSVPLGPDAASREKCARAWATWWRDHGEKVDLAVLKQAPPRLGYTLIVAPEGGSVQELDREGNSRWKITGLKSPFFAQVLAGNRVLIAEYSGQVTERTTQGEVLWQKNLELPLQCQRLPSGSTFIVTTKQLLDVDPAGKVNVIYNQVGKRPGSLLAARKLRNGQIVAIDSSGECFRLDASGAEVARFNLGKLSNNCMEVLPNGNLLVARYFDGQVVEYDATGKSVLEVKVPSAFHAVRLPGGNYLVACHQPSQVVEVDRTGKIVREFKQDVNIRPWFVGSR